MSAKFHRGAEQGSFLAYSLTCKPIGIRDIQVWNCGLQCIPYTCMNAINYIPILKAHLVSLWLRWVTNSIFQLELNLFPHAIRITSFGPRQANLVLIAYASSEGSGEPAHPLLAHTSNESRGTFRQKARSLASLNGWACAVKICHDGMLEDTNSLDGAHLILIPICFLCILDLCAVFFFFSDNHYKAYLKKCKHSSEKKLQTWNLWK